MDKEKLKQCLMDTGCSEDASENILKQYESGSMENMLRLLKKERCRIMDENPYLTAQDIADLIEEFTKDYSPRTLRKYNNLLDFKTLALWRDAKEWFDHSWSRDSFLILKKG